MKLEGVDPEHQSIYCVLTVAEVSGSCGQLWVRYCRRDQTENSGGWTRSLRPSEQTETVGGKMAFQLIMLYVEEKISRKSLSMTPVLQNGFKEVWRCFQLLHSLIQVPRTLCCRCATVVLGWWLRKLPVFALPPSLYTAETTLPFSCGSWNAFFLMRRFFAFNGINKNRFLSFVLCVFPLGYFLHAATEDLFFGLVLWVELGIRGQTGTPLCITGLPGSCDFAVTF